MSNEETFHRLSGWVKILKYMQIQVWWSALRGTNDKDNSFDKEQAKNLRRELTPSSWDKFDWEGVEELFGSLSSQIVDVFDLKVAQDDGELDLSAKKSPTRQSVARCW